MSSLARLQQDFQQAILKSDEYALGNILRTDKQCTRRKRFGVYQNAYRARLLRVLKEYFPKLSQLLGDKVFSSVMNDYITAHPSQVFSIRHIGQALSPFLQGYPLATAPALAEMAQFEWAILHALDAKDAPPFNENDLPGIPNEQWPYIEIKFHPSLTALPCQWQTPHTWTLLDGVNPQEVPIPIQTKPILCILWRQGLQNYFRSLEPQEARMYELFTQSRCFAEVCENLLELMDEETIPPFTISILKQWAADGWITVIASE